MNGPAGDAYIEVGVRTKRADRQFRRWLKSLEKKGTSAGGDAGQAAGDEFVDEFIDVATKGVKNLKFDPPVRGAEDAASKAADAFGDRFEKDIADIDATITPHLDAISKREIRRMQDQVTRASEEADATVTPEFGPIKRSSIAELSARAFAAAKKIEPEIVVDFEGDYADLKKIRTRAEQMMKHIEARIDFYVDDESVRLRLERLATKFSRWLDVEMQVSPVKDKSWESRIRRIMGELDDLLAQIPVELVGVGEELADVERRISRQEAKMLLKLDVDKSAVDHVRDVIEGEIVDHPVQTHFVANKRSIEKLGKALERWTPPTVGTEVELHRSSLDRMGSEIVRWQPPAVFVNVDPSPGSAKRFGDTFRSMLGNLTVLAKVDVDDRPLRTLADTFMRLSGGRALSSFNAEIFETISNLDQMVMQMALAGTAIGTLGAAAVAGGGALVSIVDGLTDIVPLLLVTPALIAAGVTGWFTLTSALTDAKTILEDLAPAYHDLQDAISANFWAVAEAGIRGVHDALYPLLFEYLPKIATGFGDWVTEIARVVQSAEGLKSIETFLSNLSRAISDAASGMGPLTEGILWLIRGGSEYLPKMAASFNEMANKFAQWAEAAVRSGDFVKWVDTAAENFGALVGVIAESYRIMKAFSQASLEAGGPSLVDLRNGLMDLRKTLESPVWQEGLVTMFEASYKAMSNLAPGLSALGSAIAAMAPTLAQVVDLTSQIASKGLQGIADIMEHPVFQGGLVAFFEGVKAGMEAMEANFDNVGSKFGKILELGGVLAEVIGQVLATAFEVMGPIVSAVVDALKELVPILGDMLMRAIEMVGPMIVWVVETIAAWVAANPELVATLGLVVAAFAAIVPVLTGVITAFLTVSGWIRTIITVGGFLISAVGLWPVLIGAALVALAAVVFVNFDAIKQFISDAWANITQFFADAATNISTGWNDFWSGLGAFASEVWGGFVNWLNEQIGVFTEWVTSLTTTVGEQWNAFWTGLGEAASIAWDLFTAWLGEKITAIGETFTSLGTMLSELWTMAWEGLLAIVQPMWEAITTTVTEGLAFLSEQFGISLEGIKILWETVWGTFTDVLSAVWETIQIYLAGAILGIQAVIDTGMALISAIWNGEWEKIPQIVQDFVNRVFEIVGAMVDRFSEVWGEFFANTGARWSEGWGQVREAFLQVGENIRTAAQNMMTDIGNFISDGMNNIRDWWNTSWDNIRESFDRFFTDATSKARELADSLWNSIRDGVNRIKDSWNQGWDTVREKFSSFKSDTEGNVRDFGTSINDTIRDALDNVKRWWNEGWENMARRVQEGMDDMRDMVDRKGREILQWFQDLPGRVADALSDMGRVGRDMIQGFINGALDMKGAVQNMIDNVVGGAIEWAKRKLGIHSPSRVFYALGDYTAEGYINSLEDNAGAVSKAASDMMPDADSLGVSLESVGEAMASTLATGIDSEADVVRRAAEAMADGMVRSVEDGLREMTGMASSVDLGQPTLRTDAVAPSLLAVPAMSGAYPLSGASSEVVSGPSSTAVGNNVTVNVSVSLEELSQLRDLEDFLDMIRVKKRMREDY